MLAYALRKAELVNAHDSNEQREAIVHASWAPILIGALTFVFCLFNPQQALIPLIASPLIVRGMTWIGARIARVSR